MTTQIQTQTIHLFGIRHHGPGCARALAEALERLAPDIVLVEGPPDAHDVLPLLTSPAMTPPVALLIYTPAAPKHAVYYPFTSFSPEWQALRYALTHDIPARFIDLPQSIRLAQEIAAEASETTDAPEPPDEPERLPVADGVVDLVAEATPDAPQTQQTPDTDAPTVRDDPLAMLAEAAGYTDHELWWEREVEQRQNANDLFEGILEAMTALRSDLAPKDEEEALREAHMRQGIRAAEREGFSRIAVVCGAWHTPALAQRDDAKGDAALLSKLPRVKVAATWIPWTNSRLSWRSGYGAGVGSPGWYEHLWTTTDRMGARWLAKAARLLRGEGLDVSSASVIEAVRLSEALAALRDLPMPGLDEMHEATLTVLCNGEEAPMALIREKLEIGEHLGAVPPETPAVPLQRDLETRQRHVQMKPSADPKEMKLDLRNARNNLDRERSKLLHALRLLNISWGDLGHVSNNVQGTFWEIWRVQWQPEFAIAIIEANVWGNTIESAATAAVRARAAEAGHLAELTDLLDRAILADLPDAVDDLLAHIQARAAVSGDVRRLMDALPPLARVARYGDVRGTRAERVTPVIENLYARIVVGLSAACASLDDDAANEMMESIERAQQAMDTLQRDDLRPAWQGALRAVMERSGAHGLVRGRCCRLLLEQRALDEDELRRLAGLTLSPATPTAEAAAWVAGVLRGGAQMMLAQDGLWLALDGWLAALDGETFVALLPLLRRAFADFEAPARRTMGEKVKRLHHGETAGEAGSATGTAGAVVEERARRVLPVLARVLGVSYDDVKN